METPNHPGDILFWYPTVLVKCKCQSHEMTIIIVTGFANYAACPKCGTLYATKGMIPDEKGGLSVVVDFLIKPPQETLM